MSTKSHIIYTNDAEIFSDCSCPRFIFGKWIGDDIIIVIAMESINRLTIDNHFIIITLMPNCELLKHVGGTFKIWGGNVDEFEIDRDDLVITVKGGSHTADQIHKKIFV